METSSFSSSFLYMSEDFRQFSLTVLLVPLPLVLSRRRFHASSPRIRRRVVSCFPPFVVLFFLSPFLRGPSLARTVTIRGEERPAESRIPFDAWNVKNMRRGRTKHLLSVTKTCILHHGFLLSVFARKICMCIHVFVVLLGMIETRCVKIIGKFDPYTHE